MWFLRFGRRRVGLGDGVWGAGRPRLGGVMAGRFADGQAHRGLAVSRCRISERREGGRRRRLAAGAGAVED